MLTTSSSSRTISDLFISLQSTKAWTVSVRSSPHYDPPAALLRIKRRRDWTDASARPNPHSTSIGSADVTTPYTSSLSRSPWRSRLFSVGRLPPLGCCGWDTSLPPPLRSSYQRVSGQDGCCKSGKASGAKKIVYFINVSLPCCAFFWWAPLCFSDVAQFEKKISLYIYFLRIAPPTLTTAMICSRCRGVEIKNDAAAWRHGRIAMQLDSLSH